MVELIDALGDLYDYLRAALKRYALAGQLIAEPPPPPQPRPMKPKTYALRKAKCEECGTLAELCSHCNGCFGEPEHCCVCEIKAEPALLTPNIVDFLRTRSGQYYNHVPLPPQGRYNVTTNALGDSYVVVQEEYYPWTNPAAEGNTLDENYRRGPAAHLFDEEPF